MKAAVLAKKASIKLGGLSEDIRHEALYNIATNLRLEADNIIFENKKDLDSARNEDLSPSLLDRLSLDRARIGASSIECGEYCK